MTKDYRVEVRVKNNWLMRKIEEAGYESVADFARKNKLNLTSVHGFINFKFSPLNQKGKWRVAFIDVSNALKCMPEDICPPQHLKEALKKNKSSFEADVADVAGYLTGNADTAQTAIDHITKSESERKVAEAMCDLSPKEERILRLRYGFDGPEEETYQQVGDRFDVSKERIRQIEARALRRLKHPKHSKVLRDAAENMGVTTRFHGRPPPRHYVPEWKIEEERQREKLIKKAISIYGVRAIFEQEQVLAEMEAMDNSK